MGYNTTFTLTVWDAENPLYQGRDAEFKELCEMGGEYERLDPKLRRHLKDDYLQELLEAKRRWLEIAKFEDNLFNDEPNKWYDHDLEMKAVSKVYPEFIFQLYGEGEENGDIWVKWYYKGQMQGGKAVIVRPVLDMTKWE